MRENKMLAEAIRLILTVSAQRWSEILQVPESEIEKWRRGEAYPDDRQMTTIVHHLEDGVGCRDSVTTPALLENLWAVIEKYEQDPDSFTELSREAGESVSERLTRFTHVGWDKAARPDVLHVSPRERRALIDAPHKICHPPSP